MKVPQDLLVAARAVRDNAYVPYSGFRVGAALRAANGALFAGANIENASYGLSRCAEQSAIQAMASSGAHAFTQIVIYTEAEEPATPCGACRQILFEFGPDAEVFVVNHRGLGNRFQVRELLPQAFTLG